METLEKGIRKLTFPTSNTQELEIRIVAATGLESELKQIDASKVWNKDANSIAANAKQEWANILNRICVEGGTEDQKTIFYTSLLRCFPQLYHNPADYQLAFRFWQESIASFGKMWHII